MNCSECGTLMFATSPEFLLCPRGHGKLVRHEDAEMLFAAQCREADSFARVRFEKNAVLVGRHGRTKIWNLNNHRRQYRLVKSYGSRQYRVPVRDTARACGGEIARISPLYTGKSVWRLGLFVPYHKPSSSKSSETPHTSLDGFRSGE